jgi:hypothetical protein
MLLGSSNFSGLGFAATFIIALGATFAVSEARHPETDSLIGMSDASGTPHAHAARRTQYALELRLREEPRQEEEPRDYRYRPETKPDLDRPPKEATTPDIAAEAKKDLLAEPLTEEHREGGEGQHHEGQHHPECWDCINGKWVSVPATAGGKCRAPKTDCLLPLEW